LPGALALQLDGAARGARRGLRGLAWGRVGGAGPAAAASRFARAVCALPPAHVRGAALVQVLEDSPSARATSAACLQALADADVRLAALDVPVSGLGSLRPLLLALPWLTAERAVLLLAVYRCRFLAFSFHP
jgi:hypothetical protein